MEAVAPVRFREDLMTKPNASVARADERQSRGSASVRSGRVARGQSGPLSVAVGGWAYPLPLDIRPRSDSCHYETLQIYGISQANPDKLDSV